MELTTIRTKYYFNKGKKSNLGNKLSEIIFYVMKKVYKKQKSRIIMEKITIKYKKY